MKQGKFTDNTGSTARKKARVGRKSSASARKKKMHAEMIAGKAIDSYKNKMGI